MPDIKTALVTALTQNRVREIPKDWDEENSTTKESTMPKHLFKPTNNVTRETFNFVRDNPGNTGRQIRLEMESKGFKAASVGSLLGQLARNKMVELHKPSKTYRALVSAYTPIKMSVLKASRALEIKEAKKAAQAFKKQQPIAGIATLNAVPAKPAAPAAAPAQKLLTAAQVLETLSIKEAHILYRELQTMFG